MNSLTILTFNAGLFWFWAFWLYKSKGRINLAVAAIILYAISATASVLFYQHPAFGDSIHSSKITIEPFVYLLVALFLFFIPILKLNENAITTIKLPSYKIIKIISLYTVLFSLIYFIIHLDDLKNLFLLNDMALAGLHDELLASEKVTLGIADTVNKFYNPVRELSFLLFAICLLYYKKESVVLRKWLLFASITPFIGAFLAAGRGAALYVILNYFFVILFFWTSFEKNTKRLIKIGGAIFGIIIGLYLSTITILRFGDVGLGRDMSFWTYKYLGENFINFNGLLYDQCADYTDGVKNFPVVRRLLGLSYPQTLLEQRTICEQVTGIPNFIFYTFVGSLYIDLGPVFVIIIGVVVATITYSSNTKKTVSFSGLLLFQLYYLMVVKGLFSFPYFSAIENLRIMYYFILYIVLKHNERYCYNK